MPASQMHPLGSSHRRDRHLTCGLCDQAIRPDDEINFHHPVYASQGGVETEPTHRDCHVAYHSAQGDFRAFGRMGGQISALSRRWSFNLKNVRTDPAHEMNRAFYTANYAH